MFATKVKLAESSSSPDAPASKTLPSVKSVTFTDDNVVCAVNVVVPETVKLPTTSVLACKLIEPDPLGSTTNEPLVLVVEIVLPSMVTLSMLIKSILLSEPVTIAWLAVTAPKPDEADFN